MYSILYSDHNFVLTLQLTYVLGQKISVSLTYGAGAGFSRSVAATCVVREQISVEQ